jgi:hypothetical protein
VSPVSEKVAEAFDTRKLMDALGPPGPPGRSGSRPNLEREWQLETLVRALQDQVRQLRQEVDDLKAGQQAN